MEKLKLALMEKLNDGEVPLEGTPERRHHSNLSVVSPSSSGERTPRRRKSKERGNEEEATMESPRGESSELNTTGGEEGHDRGDHEGEEATMNEDEKNNEEIIKKFLQNKFGDWEKEGHLPPLFVKDYKVATAFQAKLLDESRTLLLQRRDEELFDQDELINLWTKLEEKSTSSAAPLNNPYAEEKLLYYEEYKEFVDELVGHKNLRNLRKFLTPKLFLQLYTGDVAGRISANSVFNYMMKRTWYQQTRIGLSIYDNGRGYITDKSLECYIQELIPTLTRLNGMDPTFIPFYTGTAAKKFLFFLDPYQTRKVKILDILSCGFIDDFLDLREDTAPKDSNWFSYESSMRLYGRYLDLDKDHTGMLSKEEFQNYSDRGVSSTETFVNRIFQVYQTFEGEMDYRTYLDFVLAVENRREPASILYFFRILDVDQKGYLNAFDLHYYYKDIDAYMRKHAPDSVRFCDIKDEIFDMVKPKDPLKITLQDLIECGNGHTVMHILTDYNGFWMYETRESTSSDSPKNVMVSEV